jgi:predicted DCC family thiol-disulfide oxidoreductase YuxK
MRGELVRPGRYRIVRAKGNQQAAITEVPDSADEQRNLSWYEAQDGTLVNLDLAQQIQVYEVDDKFSIIAAYNDGSEVVLVTFDDEGKAWSELDAVKKALMGRK